MGPKKSRTRRNQSLRERWGSRWFRSLERPWVWSVFFLIAGSWALLPDSVFSPTVTPGTIAQRDFIAARDFLVLDEEATETKRERAHEAVLPVFDFDAEREGWLAAQLNALFEAAREQLAVEPELSAGDLAAALESGQWAPTLRVDQPQLALFQRLEFPPNLVERLDAAWRSLMSRGVVANKELLLENRLRGITLRNLSDGSETLQLDLFDYLGYPNEAARFLDAELARWSGLTRADRRALDEFLTQNVSPNLSFNLPETNERRSAAADGVEEVYNQVRRGQVLVRRGDEITPAAATLIAESRGGAANTINYLPILGNLLLLSLVLAAVRYGLERTRIGSGRPHRTLGAVLLLLGASLLLTRLGVEIATTLGESFETLVPVPSKVYLYAMPFAALALLVSLFFGRGVGLLAATVFSLLVGRMIGGDGLWAVLYVTSGSLAAVFALDRLNQRMAVTRAGAVVGLTSMVCVAMIIAFEGGASVTAFGLLMASPLIGGLLVAAVASFLVPVLETVLGHTTEIRLIELSDTNLPILRRLAFEAPGTFQHSLMVANLAKAGCEAIDANPVLAYAGALYHDIGKMSRPAYFVENQRDVNPHDKLAPSMSALIVINHVKEGIDLAREHGLPQTIVDAIEQHHGTRVLKFFYERAKANAGENIKVDEHKYQYPGPKPQNKTMAVLMYADSVEAASRTLRNPSAQNIDALLERLLNDHLVENQFDETDLTLSDLRNVREAFARVLQTIYHKRVDYPGYDFEKAARAELRMIRGGG